MSGISGVSSSGTDTGTLGDQAPISFPGISSGIDYNSIIEKLTSLTLAQNKPLQTELTKLTAQNTELIKIKTLVTNVQDAISSLSDPTLFNQFLSTVSNPSVATATQIAGQQPSAGTTTVLSQQLATSTQITSDATSNQPVTAASTLGSTKFGTTVTYGTSGQGHLTIDGQQITYSASTTIAQVVTAINGLTGVSASFANNQLTITSTNGQALAIGSAADDGNLATALKLDTAPLTNYQTTSSTVTVAGTDTLAADGETVDGSFTVNGQTVSYTGGETVNALLASLNGLTGVSATINGANKIQISSNSGALTIAGDTGDLVSAFGLGSAPSTQQKVTSAGPIGSFNLITPLAGYGVTGSIFTINGVAISVNPAGDGLNNVISKINASAAGVTAQFNASTGQLELVAKATGPQSIVLGAPGDDSNLLTIVGLKGGGFTPTTQVGTQAQVSFLNASGNPQTVYSNSNTLSSVIPGVNLQLNASSSSPYTITTASDSSGLVTAIGNFTTAYNKAIDEINAAIAPPVVQAPTSSQAITAGTALSTQLTSGGPLYNNFSVQQLKDKLVNITTGLFQTGSSSFNSLASVGLQLDNSVGVLTSNSTTANDSTDASGLSVQTFDGTSGKFTALDTTKLAAALASNPNAVQSIFTSSIGVSQQLGSYLTYVTGSPTLVGGLHGNYAAQVPNVSLISSIETATSNEIQSVNQQIQLVQNSATQQADSLRREFTASESLIAQLQAEQQSLAGFINQNNSSSSS